MQIIVNMNTPHQNERMETLHDVTSKTRSLQALYITEQHDDSSTVYESSFQALFWYQQLLSITLP